MAHERLAAVTVHHTQGQALELSAGSQLLPLRERPSLLGAFSRSKLINRASLESDPADMDLVC